jgi:hypothetical protein
LNLTYIKSVKLKMRNSHNVIPKKAWI